MCIRDRGAGKGNTEKKEEELAELQAKAQSATAAQMSILADANKSVEEAAKAENSNTEDTATKNNTDKSEKTQESAGTASEAVSYTHLQSVRFHGIALCVPCCHQVYPTTI